MRITGLTSYPVKALSGVDVEDLAVAARGPVDDRRWALLDPEGNRVYAAQCPAMLGLTATPTSTGVRVSDRQGGVLEVTFPGPDATATPTGIPRISELLLADDDAHDWFSERLGRPLRLAFQASEREIGSDHGGLPGEPLSLAYSGPLHLITEASVRQLGDWVVEATQAPWIDHAEARRRFRPNVVVDGEEPFAEDRWSRVRLGGLTFRVNELCDRCVVTTIDLTTLKTTKQPIATLAQHRKWDGATWFGIRLVPNPAPAHPVNLRLGDPVEVLA